MQEEWVAMQDHIAELEAELMLKDAEIRQKDSDLRELRSTLSDLLTSDKSLAEGYEAKVVYKEQLTLRRMANIRNRVISELGTNGVKGGLKTNPKDANMGGQGVNAELDLVKVQLLESQAESRQLRDGLTRLESEVDKYSKLVRDMNSIHADLVSVTAGGLVSGMVDFVLIKGPAMTRGTKRLSCLQHSYGFFFDAGAQKVEHKFAYSDVSVKAKISGGELVMEFDSRGDALTYRLRVAEAQIGKWKWAYEKLFGRIDGSVSSSSDDVLKEVAHAQAIRTSKYARGAEESDSDDDSASGSLSSLPGVRLSLPPQARRTAYQSNTSDR